MTMHRAPRMYDIKHVPSWTGFLYAFAGRIHVHAVTGHCCQG
jgi:hypothetical protein